MPNPPSFGKIEVNLSTETGSSRTGPEPDIPCRIALLGDFSNRTGRSTVEPNPDLAHRHPVPVDRDNFDQVLAQHGLELQLPAKSESRPRLTIPLAAPDDFHPDRIFVCVEAFQPLRQMRKRLEDSASFAAAAAEMQTWAGTESGPAAAEQAQGQPSAAPDLSRISPNQLLEQMFDETQQRAPQAGSSRDLVEWNALVRELVRPYLIPRANPQQAELLVLLDAAASRQMRAILHDPVFQAVEAAWPSVFFLVRRLEINSQLQLYLVDISKAELAADLGSAGDLRSTGTYRLLVEQSVGTLGGQPWAVLAGNYTFDHRREDAELLGRLAKIARQAGVPFLAGVSPHVPGCTSWAETADPDDWQQPIDPQDRQAWEALRRLPGAMFIGLALSRFRLRLPYGADSEPTERFPFEEMPETPRHGEYLWGNPAFACVYLFAEAFSQYGWSIRPGMVQEIEGLPLHISQKDGESLMQPCTEAWLTERAAERILELGLMLLLSLRGRDVVRLARFQSLASPAAPLAGRWRG